MTDATPEFYWGPTSHVLHVSLEDVEPSIWRRVRVPSDVELVELNEILVLTMGWQGYHMHEFQIGGMRFGWNDDDSQLIDEAGIRVEQVLPQVGATAIWMYDFGDDWSHRVVVEAIEPMRKKLKAQAMAGERSCPPEDSGGPWGYLDKLRVVADPSHDEHEFIVGWMPDGFDSEAFDVDEVNIRLKAR